MLMKRPDQCKCCELILNDDDSESIKTPLNDRNDRQFIYVHMC